MKIKNVVFEVERKEIGQEVVMRNLGAGESRFHCRGPERKQYLCSPQILSSSNV